MYHSITFGDKNTWDDWFLIPSSRPVFSPPEPKTTFIDIPGGDGHADLTDYLRGEVSYKVREGSIEFIVDNIHRDKEWHVLYSEIMNYLHGKKMKAFLEDDPSYYYEGRFKVNDWKSEPQNSIIVIDYVVAPYKMEKYSSIEDWEWDSFNFETDLIRDYKDMVVDGELKFTLYGNRKTVVPTITVTTSDGSSLLYNHMGQKSPRAINVMLKDGTNKYSQIVYKDGETWITITGTGTITIDYRGGSL